MRLKVQSFWILSMVVAVNVSMAAPIRQSGQEAGFKMLERLVLLMGRAGQGSGSLDQWNAELLSLARELKSGRDAKRIDALFAVRYSRLLSGVRQALSGDPELLYWPMYRFSMVDFIEERTGRMPDWNKLLFVVSDHGGSGVGLAMIVEAVMSEVVNLHIYLESLDKRQGILQMYLQKSSQASKTGK